MSDQSEDNISRRSSGILQPADNLDCLMRNAYIRRCARRFARVQEDDTYRLIEELYSNCRKSFIGDDVWPFFIALTGSYARFHQINSSDIDLIFFAKYSKHHWRSLCCLLDDICGRECKWLIWHTNHICQPPRDFSVILRLPSLKFVYGDHGMFIEFLRRCYNVFLSMDLRSIFCLYELDAINAPFQRGDANDQDITLKRALGGLHQIEFARLISAWADAHSIANSILARCSAEIHDFVDLLNLFRIIHDDKPDTSTRLHLLNPHDSLIHEMTRPQRDKIYTEIVTRYLQTKNALMTEYLVNNETEARNDR
jgi:hypothetical protein